MDEPPQRPIVANGRCFTVAYAVCNDGSSPAKEFVDGCDKRDRAKLAFLIQNRAELGLNEWRNREKFKPIGGPLFEFKSFQIRILCFRDGATWVLTHGFVKKKDDIPPAEIERARRIMREDLARRPPAERLKR
jgi:Phage derived protein Gp49-like (DUF891)